jgi:uncharacterized membrane protein
LSWSVVSVSCLALAAVFELLIVLVAGSRCHRLVALQSVVMLLNVVVLSIVLDCVHCV